MGAIRPSPAVPAAVHRGRHYLGRAGRRLHLRGLGRASDAHDRVRRGHVAPSGISLRWVIPIQRTSATWTGCFSSAPSMRTRTANCGAARRDVGRDRLVRDIESPGASSPMGLTEVGRAMHFWPTTARTGGTLAERRYRGRYREVKDINPVGDSSRVSLTSLGGFLYFWADDGTHGHELWRSDGTDTGTAMVMDINPSGRSSGDRTTAPAEPAPPAWVACCSSAPTTVCTARSSGAPTGPRPAPAW